MAIRVVVLGPLGRIHAFVRQNGRCPFEEFESELPQPFRKRFRGSFDVLALVGARYMIPERFKPLHDTGKPLWEFKEADHRLYCVREVIGQAVQAVLLSGWVKQKSGRSSVEDRAIDRAQRLRLEYEAERKGQKI